MKRMFALPLILSLPALSAPVAFAQVAPVPPLMNFQGRLAKPDGTPVANASYAITFSLFDAAMGGSKLWEQTLSSVSVRNGTFATKLNFDTGYTVGNSRISVFANPLFTPYLEIKVGADAPLTPRQSFASVPYSLFAQTALTVPDASITNAKIVNVDWSKILNAPASNFTLPYVGIYDNPSAIAFTLKTKVNAIAAYGRTLNAPTIYAENSASGSIGYFTGNNFGAYGYSPAGAGVYGTSGGGNGVEGHTSRANFSGIAGAADTPSGYGASGRHTSTNNVGFLGTVNAGVYGDAVDGNSNGVWGHANNSNNAVYGANGGNGPGVGGVSVNGIGTYGVSTNFTGVFGQTSNAATAGGHFKNTAGGLGLLVEGTASVTVLEIRGGADLAEKFAVNGKIEPGMVVEIDPDHEGKLRLASGAFNRRVAGVISGAKNLSAGVVLTDPSDKSKESLPVAMSGRVWVYTDATERAVEPGDFMTTAERAGHAKPVSKIARAQGAILGKAMSRLRKGKVGLVLVLVNLQ